MGWQGDEFWILPLALSCVLLITVAVWFAVRNKSEKIQNLPFIVVTIVMVVGEVVKQVVGLLSSEGYDLWFIPAHFCSTYFIWYTLAEFSPKKHRQTMRNIAFVASLYFVALFYFYPSGILSCEGIFKKFSTFHSFFFHHLVLLYFTLSVALKRFKPTKKDVLPFIVCMICYYVVAVILAYALDTNYMNILHSVIFFVEEWRVKFGQVPYNIGLGAVIIFSGAIFMWILAIVKGKLDTKKQKTSD